MALIEHRTATYSLEIAAWSLPAALAFWLFVRSAGGARASWLVVALMTTGFALDKAVDLHALLRSGGQAVVAWLDPETRFRGEKLVLRVVLLGGIFSAGLACLWWFVRTDRDLTPSKLAALGGLLVVMAYLGVRLMPGVGKAIERSGAGWWIEASAWLLVVVGELGGLRALRSARRGSRVGG